MAHYAFLDENNIVTQVIVGADETADVDWEQHYGELCGQTCKRTSYNTQGGVHLLGGVPFRKNYAGVGYSFDPILDAFIPPKPYPSWTLDEQSCTWTAPTPRPSQDMPWMWDESAGEWTLPTPPADGELSDLDLKALSDQIAQALA